MIKVEETDLHNDYENISFERTKDYLSKVQKIAKLGFWELDLVTGKIWWSEEVFTIFDFNPKLGTPSTDQYLSRIHQDDIGKLKEARSKAIEAGTGYSMRFRVVRQDGSICHVKNFAEIEKNSENCPVKMFGVVQSITEKVAKEKLIEEQNMQLMSSSNLAAIAEMASGIAHEINNPLAIIVGKTRLFQRHFGQDSINKELILRDLQTIERASFRISSIIQSLRAITDSNKFKEATQIRISEVINSTMSLCQERITLDSVKFDMNIHEDILLKGNLAELTQALLALLFNAHDAVMSFEEKWIRLEVKKLNSSNIEISITDSGKGIPKSLQAKIMQPFFTTKEIGKGTGLGLSLAKKL